MQPTVAHGVPGVADRRLPGQRLRKQHECLDGLWPVQPCRRHGCRTDLLVQELLRGGYDKFMCMASIDDANYYGWSVSGNQSTWQTNGLDFKNIYTLGNICGQPQVWLAFIFTSDGSISGPTYTGTFVDDVLLTKSSRSLAANLAPFTPCRLEQPDRRVEADRHVYR